MLTRTFSCLLLVLFVFISACKKNHSTPVAGYSVQLVSGGGQTDTIGRRLSKELLVLPKQNGSIMRSGYLRFETMSCDNTPVDLDISFAYQPGPNPPNPVSYLWQLNQTIGLQTLKVILLDSVKDHLDSTTVTATGIPPSSGWHISGCIPINAFCQAFAQLPSGRIFTAVRLNSYQSAYPYYSDDDGSTWHAITSFPVTTTQITNIVTTRDNEVFITIPNTGIYYSNDKGLTWQQRSSGLPLTYYSGDLSYTATGILIVGTGYTIADAYYSADKGVTWLPANGLLQGGQGSAVAAASFAGSMTDGTIIAILNESLRKSRDGGANWTFINTSFRINDMMVDSNNNINIAVMGDLSRPSGIYQSKDTGQTWTFVYDPTSLPEGDKSITQIQQKNGLLYFYATGDNLLVQTSNFANYNYINPPVQLPDNDGGRISFRYLVTNDHRFIMSTEWNGLFYQTP